MHTTLKTELVAVENMFVLLWSCYGVVYHLFVYAVIFLLHICVLGQNLKSNCFEQGFSDWEKLMVRGNYINYTSKKYGFCGEPVEMLHTFPSCGF